MLIVTGANGGIYVKLLGREIRFNGSRRSLCKTRAIAFEHDTHLCISRFPPIKEFTCAKATRRITESGMVESVEFHSGTVSRLEVDLQKMQALGLYGKALAFVVWSFLG